MRKILSFLFATLFTIAINAETWEAGAEIAAADLQAGDIILLQNANTGNADAMWFGGYHIVKNKQYDGGCTNYSLGMFPAIKDRSAFELVAGPTMEGHASFYFKEVTTGQYIGVALEAGGYAELKADISEATSFVPTAQGSGAYLISYKDGTGWRFMPFHSYGEMYIGTGGDDMAGFKFFRAVEKATSFSKGAQISCYEVSDGMEILLCAPYSYYANRSATLGDMYLENTQISETAHTYINTAFSAVPALATSVGYNEDNVWVLEYASPSTTSGYSDYYYLKSKSTGEYLFRDADAAKQSSATTADKTKAESFSFAPKSVKEYGNGINVINDKTITMIPKDQTYRWFGSAHGYGFAVFNSENFANWNLHLAGISDKVLVNGLYYTFNGTTATVTYPGDAEPTADAPSSYTGDIVIPATVTYGGQEYSVTSVGNNAFRYSTVTSVTFAEGLKTIGDHAFQCCRGLTTVELPNSVGALGKEAFAGASGKRMNITTFRFGKNIATCDKFLYYNSTSITTDVYVPTYIVPYTGQYPVEGVAANRIHVYPSMVADFEANLYWARYNIIGDLPEVYVNGICYELDETSHTAKVINRGGVEPTASAPSIYTGDVVIPASIEYDGVTYDVTSVADNAFKFSTITSITFSEGMQTIGTHAFADISTLTGTVELPNSVTKVNYEAFASTPNISTLIFGSGITSIGQGVCYSQANAQDIYVKTTTVPSLGMYAFYWQGATIHVYSDMVTAFQSANNWNDTKYTIVGDLTRDYTYAELQAKAAEAQGYALFVGNNPGQYSTASYAAVENALASYAALDAASPASAINASMLEFSNAIDALLASTPNPITEGYYFIVCDNANIAANGKPEKALYANKDMMQLYWGELETADLKFVFRFTDNGDGTWNLQNMDNGLYAGAATGFCVETSVTETADYPVTFYFDGEGSYRIKANNWTYCPQGNPEGNQDGPSYVWGYNAEGIHGEASYTLRAIDAATMNGIIGSMITDMDEITTSDDPGRYTASSVATYNTALNTAKEAAAAGTADITTYESLLAAKNHLATNPIAEGYYFIASAGNGPGYSGGPYEYEDDDAMYNADGIVKWKAYDSTDASQLYYLTQKADNSWYVYNVMDATYIDNGGSGNSSTVRSSTDKVNGQEFHPMVAGTGKFAIKSPSYCYGLAANHNGSPNAEGNLCIWGTVNDCYSFGVNVWYLHKISNADAEQLIADAVASTNTVVAMPTNETGDHTNVIVNGVCSDLVLTDGQPFSAPGDFTATTATYTRAMSNEWGTICLPYDVSSSSTAKYYTVSAIENKALVVSEVATLTAGTPGLVQKVSGDAITATATNVPVSATIAAPSGSVEMYGVYETTRVEDPNAYYIKDNKFWQCNNYFFCGAFRAYFTASGAGSNSFSIVTDNDDPTAIAFAEADNDAAVAIYSTDGTRLGTLQKGVNIVKLANGKTQKVVVK